MPKRTHAHLVGDAAIQLNCWRQTVYLCPSNGSIAMPARERADDRSVFWARRIQILTSLRLPAPGIFLSDDRRLTGIWRREMGGPYTSIDVVAATPGYSDEKLDILPA